ncbi:2-oxoglutarate-dependent dioxygenase 33-like [Portunus trituberculatus]|uniref:2-oxoglutarate-dependent dioxygenase 33-like n=1 Tax=Portunus trituberculatus TaxID=210409 RepID=UPI001E1CC7F5|nr:2-oxoglutarate-dependent dioxygenase 33-like [Portunus trituberculatus]
MQNEVPPCTKVPTVDMGNLGAHHVEEPCQLEWERVTRELEQAFSDIGCAYLTGHGVPDHLINEMLSTSVAFFKQQEEVKIRWAKDTNVHGYMKMNSERYAGAGPELHESFLFKPDSYSSCIEEAPLFMTPLPSLHELHRTLSRRLMTCLALSVGKNRDHFVNMHLESGTKNSCSIYRLNYYPLTSDGREDVTGFGAHIDFTTLSFIYNNGSKGLQIRDSAGQWIDVPYVPGTILLLAGEFLHFHSNKKFTLAMHRVVLPSKVQPGQPPRCTLIWFEHADSHQPMWPPSEDPNQPAPPGVKDYLLEKINAAYKSGSRD